MIQLPLSSTGLSLAEAAASVIYAVNSASDGTVLTGVLSSEEVDIEDDMAVFETMYFGSFQVIRTENKIMTAMETETEMEINQKKLERLKKYH